MLSKKYDNIYVLTNIIQDTIYLLYKHNIIGWPDTQYLSTWSGSVNIIFF